MAMSKSDYIQHGREQFAAGVPLSTFSDHSWQGRAMIEGWRAAATLAMELPPAGMPLEKEETTTIGTLLPAEVDHGACAIIMHLRSLRHAAHAANGEGKLHLRNRLIRKVDALERKHAQRLAAVGVQLP